MMPPEPAPKPPASLLIDNDAFVLLAAADHLSAAIAALGFTIDQCRILPTLTHVFRKRIAKKFSPEMADRIQAEIAKFKPLETEPSAAAIKRFDGQADIDPGEVVLFADLSERSTSLLTTNDKRALRAVSAITDPADARSSIAGRVVCVEALIRKLVVAHTVAVVGPGFSTVAAFNSAMAVCFSPTCLADQDQCLAALDGYIKEITGQCGADFFYTL
ncbi:hypothetical protein BH11PLA1_BH11PLA1_18380 [soil metagenome]